MICKVKSDYILEIADIAWESYEKECSYNSHLQIGSKEEMTVCISEEVHNENGLVFISDNKVIGYFFYQTCVSEDGSVWCSTPFWGYGAIGDRREKVISKLFQQVAEELCKVRTVHFEVKVYAHDHEILKLFSFLQFGIQCEEGIRDTKEQILIPACSLEKETNDSMHCCLDEVSVSELNRSQIEGRWSEIWALLQQLIIHLQKSPVFYPGREFTQEIYQAFFLDEDTRVFAARSGDRLIGIIEVNSGGNSYLTSRPNARNTGEIFVLKSERGRGIAQMLLECVNNTLYSEGIDILWVEHGTANPNGRGFWNKYFDTYCYSMIRDIQPL